MSLLLALLTNLPEILKLLQAMQQANSEQELKRKIRSDLATIEKAFREKDADAITRLFASR